MAVTRRMQNIQTPHNIIQGGPHGAEPLVRCRLSPSSNSIPRRRHNDLISVTTASTGIFVHDVISSSDPFPSFASICTATSPTSQHASPPFPVPSEATLLSLVLTSPGCFSVIDAPGESKRVDIPCLDHRECRCMPEMAGKWGEYGIAAYLFGRYASAGQRSMEVVGPARLGRSSPRVPHRARSLAFEDAQQANLLSRSPRTCSTSFLAASPDPHDGDAEAPCRRGATIEAAAAVEEGAGVKLADSCFTGTLPLAIGFTGNGRLDVMPERRPAGSGGDAREGKGSRGDEEDVMALRLPIPLECAASSNAGATRLPLAHLAHIRVQAR
ncbi:hypothetical protein R3P38DRAFT_3181630 [Favolaschia claudopus]|uniref:Uncharacterized protein n=1 Tax=Favolaschia claudopus TaxID=2862362 RepID=A0AAW0CN16_9AGAR